MLTSFLGWVLRTVVTAAEAEMNDDTALREQLLEAEMRREMEEISEEEFKEIEADLLARIREIKQRREGGGPLTTGGALPIETSPDSTFQIEANVAGDFYDPSEAPHTTIVETEPGHTERISVLDMEPGDAEGAPEPGLPLTSAAAVGRATAPHRAGAVGAPPSGSPARGRQGSRHKPTASQRKLRKS